MKKKETIILISVFLLIPLFILWGNVFSVFDYYLNEANNHGIMIKKKKLDNRTVLFNPYYKNHPFSRVELELKFSDVFLNSDIKQPLVVSVYENIESMAYPEQGVINNTEELKHYLYFNNDSNLPNGSLFSNGDSVFFVSRGEYRPVLSSEIFEKLLFDWDVVIPQETGIFSVLKEGEKIVFNSAHPDGVIIRKDSSFYLIWEEKLINIKDEKIIEEAWVDYYTISPNVLEELDLCELEVKNNKSECSFNVSSSSFSGENQPYIFKFNEDIGEHIIDAHTRLKVSFQSRDMKKAFWIMLANAKEDFVNKYREYLF